MPGKREERMNEITERLEQGVEEFFTSEKYTDYLKTMSQFHDYSFNNTLLIAMQKPDASYVAGYDAWQNKFNRQVKRGEKGIQIIAPAPHRYTEEREKRDELTGEVILNSDGQPEMEQIVHVVPNFHVTTVFDVSQTYGEPLPELGVNELTDAVADFDLFMKALEEASPVPIRFDDIPGDANGYYDSGKKEIVIKAGMSESQTLETAVHEVTHAELHDRDIMAGMGIEKDQLTKEVEAGSVAYTVCQHFGIETSDFTFPYIASWSSGKDMKELRGSMDTIRHTSADLIDGIEDQMEIQKEQALNNAEKENLLFADDKTDRFAIYQINEDNPGKEYLFMNSDYISDHGMSVKGSDYNMVYEGSLGTEETLDSLYEKFNIHHPEDFTGHSLSVSDVVAMKRDGETKAYFVDSFGFKEMPDFMQERKQMMETPENEQEKARTPVYLKTAAYARENGEIDIYRESVKENIACKEAIEGAIKENFDGMHLNGDVIKPVLEQFGEERTSYILANTIKHKDWDGRFSNDNKAWAQNIPMAEVGADAYRTDRSREWVVESHPAVLNGYVDMYRGELKEKTIEKETQKDEQKDFRRNEQNEQAETKAETGTVENDESAKSNAEIETPEINKLDAEVRNFAAELDNFTSDHDPYEYRDSVDDPEQNISMIVERVESLNTAEIKEWLVDVIDNSEDEAEVITAGDFLKDLNTLEEKVKAAEVGQEEPTLTYYVAECMEFPVLGEFHENLTLQEAVEAYNNIPTDRMNGIKGIGIDLEDGSIYSGQYPLMSGGKIDMDTLDHVGHYKESPLVQEAVQGLQEALPVELERSSVSPVKETAAKEADPRETGGKVAKEERSDSTRGSVLTALKEHQAKIKEQDKQPDKKVPQQKKGELAI